MIGPPNILWIVTDQQRFDSLGCYGSTTVPTPNLDRLAAGGTRFDKCYCTNPICTPSRASMLTGHHVARHGVRDLDGTLADKHVLLPEHLRRLGYHTGLVGKLHVQSGHIESKRRHPNDGFDVYDFYYGGGAMMDSPLNAYAPWLEARQPRVFQRLRERGKAAGVMPADVHMTTWAAERTLDFIDHRPQDRPFFCMMSVFDPHNPYDDHPPEYEERLDKMPVMIPPDRDVPEAILRERHDNYFADFDTLSPQDLLAIQRGYFASIALIDEQVGRVLDHLDALDLADSTLVVFTSDHGDMLGDHGLLVKGAVPYEANIHVPLLVRWPGHVDSGTVSDDVVQLNDLAAISLQAAGGDISLMPDAIDSLRSRREVATCVYHNSGLAKGHVPFDPPIQMAVATDGRWKLCRYGDGQELLFDLATDPTEGTTRDPATCSTYTKLAASIAPLIQS